MTQYHVSWSIDIEADDPQEAAAKARATQLRPGTIATVFDVSEDGMRIATIDLTYPGESEYFTVADHLNPDPDRPEPRENAA